MKKFVAPVAEIIQLTNDNIITGSGCQSVCPAYCPACPSGCMVQTGYGDICYGVSCPVYVG